MDRIATMPTTLEAPAPGARPVVLPIVSEPAVTVMIVTYGGYDLAIRAIACVADRTEAAVEVIVVDNASPDGTGLRLERRRERPVRAERRQPRLRHRQQPGRAPGAR